MDKRKIQVVFLEDLIKRKQNYFVDTKDILKVSIHRFMWDTFMCSKTRYDYKDICSECDCLFCEQKIKSEVVYYADILIFNNKYQYDNNKILILSLGELQMLLSYNTCLLLNDKNLDLNQVYPLLLNIQDNKSIQVKKIKSYESWVKQMMNLTKNYAK